tara:strand:- start:677 stop:814 length:138 start_codon:yes stop_codon:yes gene_type:complete
MARNKAISNGNLNGVRKKRPGRHSKKISRLKSSKNYKKKYRGQGK